MHDICMGIGCLIKNECKLYYLYCQYRDTIGFHSEAFFTTEYYIIKDCKLFKNNFKLLKNN